MSIPGLEVIKLIEAQRDPLIKRAEASAHFISVQEKNLLELFKKRKDAYLELANKYLPQLNHDHIHKVFDHVDERLTKLLVAKAEINEKSAPVLEEISSKIDKLKEREEEVVESVGALKEQVEESDEKLRKDLVADTTFQKKSIKLKKLKEKKARFFPKLKEKKLARLERELMGITEEKADALKHRQKIEELAEKEGQLEDIDAAKSELEQAEASLKESVVDQHAPSSDFYQNISDMVADILRAQGLQALCTVALEQGGSRDVETATKIDKELEEVVGKVAQIEKERLAHKEAVENLTRLSEMLGGEARFLDFDEEGKLEAIVKEVAFLRMLPDEAKEKIMELSSVGNAAT